MFFRSSGTWPLGLTQKFAALKSCTPELTKWESKFGEHRHVVAFTGVLEASLSVSAAREN